MKALFLVATIALSPGLTLAGQPLTNAQMDRVTAGSESAVAFAVGNVVSTSVFTSFGAVGSQFQSVSQSSSSSRSN